MILYEIGRGSEVDVLRVNEGKHSLKGKPGQGADISGGHYRSKVESDKKRKDRGRQRQGRTRRTPKHEICMVQIYYLSK